MINYNDGMKEIIEALHKKKDDEAAPFIIASSDHLCALLLEPLFDQITKNEVKATDLVVYFSAFKLASLSVQDFIETRLPAGFPDECTHAFWHDVFKYSDEHGFLKKFKEANRKNGEKEDKEDADNEGGASEGD